MSNIKIEVANIFKKIIIVIDIVVLIIIFWHVYSNYNKTKLNSNKSELSTVTYKFERFIFEAPSVISITEINEKQFKIKGVSWYAIVEPYIDRKNHVYKYPNVLYQVIKNNGYNVTEPYKIMVDNNLVVILNKLAAKSVLCYLEYNDIIGYEIDIYNDDQSYNRNALNEIVPILIDAQLISDNGKPSPYDNIDYSNYITSEDTTMDEQIDIE